VEAAKHAGEALESAKDADDLANIACCLVIFAALAARRLDGERAALLLGASRRVYRDIELMVEPSEQVLLEDAARRIRDLLDDEERQAAELAGAALGTAQAVEVALRPAS